MGEGNRPCKLYSSLSLLEISLYIFTWVSGVFIACFSFYIASQEEGQDLKKVTLMQPWWNFWSSNPIGRDASDYEWETWKKMSQKIGHFLLLYPVLSQFCKIFFKNTSLLIGALYSVMVTMYLIGVLPTFFLFLQIIAIWMAYHMNSSKMVWIVAISYLICLNLFPLKNIKDSLFPDKSSQNFQGPLTSIFLAIMNLRCISFSLDRIWNKVEREEVFTSFLMLTAYCFYLPLLMLGPHVDSKTFKASFNSLNESPLCLHKTSWVLNLSQCLRLGVWFTVTDASLYFLYQHAFRLHLVTVNSMSLWSLCGMGYFMLLYFQTKYTVMYGCSGFLAHLDNVSAPPHPKCFARIHLYSDVWRYFDRGLYLFIKQ